VAQPMHFNPQEELFAHLQHNLQEIEVKYNVFIEQVRAQAAKQHEETNKNLALLEAAINAERNESLRKYCEKVRTTRMYEPPPKQMAKDDGIWNWLPWFK